MPTKAASTRIDDTLTYIGGCTGVDAKLVQDAHAFADAYIGRAQWNTKVYTTRDAQNNPVSGNYRHFSNHMTMTDATTPGTKDQRAMRRAILLLRSAIGDTQAAAYAKSILVTDVHQAFEDTIAQAACTQNQQVGKPDANEYVFKRLLRDDPIGFLGRVRVIVRGSTKVDSASNTNKVAFTFSYDAPQNRFVFGQVPSHGTPTPGAFGLDVSSVPAFQWDTVPGRGDDPARGSFDKIRATELSEKCMVTTQLIGCSFCLQDAGGSLFACHLKPGAGIDGTQLAQQLTGQVPNVTRPKFSNAPKSTNPVYVFGRGHGSFPNGGGYDVRLEGGSRYATVIGLKRKGVWSLYAQEVYDNVIIGVRKIWP
jgi:hypothetical protein